MTDIKSIPSNNWYPLPASGLKVYIAAPKGKNAGKFEVMLRRGASGGRNLFKNPAGMIAHIIKKYKNNRNSLRNYYKDFDEFNIDQEVDLYAYPGETANEQNIAKEYYRQVAQSFKDHAAQYKIEETDEKDKEQKANENDKHEEDDGDSDYDINISGLGPNTPAFDRMPMPRRNTRSQSISKQRAESIFGQYKLQKSAGQILTKCDGDTLYVELNRCPKDIKPIKKILLRTEDGDLKMLYDIDFSSHFNNINRNVLDNGKQLKGIHQNNKLLSKLANKFENMKKYLKYKRNNDISHRQTMEQCTERGQERRINQTLEVINNKIGNKTKVLKQLIRKLVRKDKLLCDGVIHIPEIEMAQTKHLKNVAKGNEHDPAHIYSEVYFATRGHQSGRENNNNKLNRENDTEYKYDATMEIMKPTRSKNNKYTDLVRLGAAKWATASAYCNSLDVYRNKAQVWATKTPGGLVKYIRHLPEKQHIQAITKRMMTHPSFCGMLRNLPHAYQLERVFDEQICELDISDKKYKIPKKDDDMLEELIDSKLRIDDNLDGHMDFDLLAKEEWDGKGHPFGIEHLAHFGITFPGTVDPGLLHSKHTHPTFAIGNVKDGDVESTIEYLKYRDRNRPKKVKMLLFHNKEIDRKLWIHFNIRRIVVLDLSASFSAAVAKKYCNKWVLKAYKNGGVGSTLLNSWRKYKFVFEIAGNTPDFEMDVNTIPDDFLTDTPSKYRLYLNEQFRMKQNEMILTGKYTDLNDVYKEIRAECDELGIPFYGVGVESTFSFFIDSTHSKNAGWKHSTLNPLHEMRHFAKAMPSLKGKEIEMLNVISKRNINLKSTNDTMIKKFEETASDKKISAQWIGEVRKNFQEQFTFVTCSTANLYSKEEQILSVAVDHINGFIMECYSMITEEFYFVNGCVLLILSYIKFCQIFSSYARKLFPNKYKEEHYLNFIHRAFGGKILAIGLEYGLMPAAYSTQGIELKGAVIARHCRFMNKHPIRQLPPQNINTNDKCKYDENDINRAQIMRNSIDMIWDRNYIEDNAWFDHNHVSFISSWKRQKELQKKKKEVMDKCKQLPDDFNYLDRSAIPDLLNIPYFKPAVDKYFNWDTVAKTTGIRNISKPFINMVEKLLKIKSAYHRLDNMLIQNAKKYDKRIGFKRTYEVMQTNVQVLSNNSNNSNNKSSSNNSNNTSSQSNSKNKNKKKNNKRQKILY